MASTNIQSFPGKVGVSNTNPIHTLDIGSNVYIDDAADTKVRVVGNIHASGITVDGNITVIETDNLSVKDPVLLLASGSTGTSDTGIIMKRADGDANVAVFYDEGVGLKICHTMSSGDEIHLTADTANALATSVYGPVTIENTGVQSLSVSGGAQINKTLQIGTIANLYVDTTTSNVGIGTNAPAYKLDVHGESNVGVLTASTISVAGATPTGSNVLEINGNASVDGTLTTDQLKILSSIYYNDDAVLTKTISSNWVQKGSDIDGGAASDTSGHSVSLSSDGSIVAIGAPYNDAGHVRIYEWSGSAWVQKGSDIDGEAANDSSGWSVSLSSDGSIVAIGARFNDGNGSNAGHVRIYEWSGSAWVQKGLDIDGEAAGDQFGRSVSLSSDGSIVAIGTPFNDANGMFFAGHVRIYEWSGSAWVQKGSDIDGEAAGDQSGWSVSLSSDGSIVAIGVPFSDGNGSNAGHVRIYEWSGSAWVQKGSDIDGEAAGDRGGWYVSLSSDGSIVAIGAPYNQANGTSAGHVRIYEWSGSAWVQKGSDIDGEAAGDQSGWSVSLSSDGSIVIIGAIYNDDNGTSAGHARIYEWSGSAWVQKGSDIDGEAAGDSFGISVSISSDGSVVAIGGYYNDGNGAEAGHVRVYELPSYKVLTTDKIYTTSNVGIGTTDPQYKLDVLGSANVGVLTASTIYGEIAGSNAITASTIYGEIAGSNAITASTIYGEIAGSNTITASTGTFSGALTLPRVSGHAAGAETPRAESLVVHYDTTVDSVVSGTTVVDISGSGINGTLRNGASYSSTDRALTFDGVNDFVYDNSPSGLPTGDAIYSISAWVNIYTFASSSTVFAFGSAWGCLTMGSMYIASNGILAHSIGCNQVYTTNQTITSNTWHHAVVVKKGTGANSVGNVDLYVDGLLITDKTASGTGTQNIGSAGFVTVGAGTIPSELFNGKISKPKLWNVALTAEEVAAEYALGRTGKSINLTDTALCLGGTVPRAQLDVRGSAMFDGGLVIKYKNSIEYARDGGIMLSRAGLGNVTNKYSSQPIVLSGGDSGAMDGNIRGGAIWSQWGGAQYGIAMRGANVSDTYPYLQDPTLFVTKDKVGIGNTNPGFPLTIGTTDGNKILFNQSGTTPGHNITCSSGWQWNFNAARSGQDDDAKITFNISGSSGYDEMMRINHTGVGIGTVSPSHKLTVAAASGDAEVHIQAQGNGSTGAIIYFNGSATNQRKCAIISSPINSWCRQDLHFCHNTSLNYDDVTVADSKMVITNAGNVGIGSTQPAQLLDVAGAGKFDEGLRLVHSNSQSNTITFDGSSYFTIASYTTAFSSGLYSVLVAWGNETNTSKYWFGEASGILYINSAFNANYSFAPATNLALNQRYHHRSQNPFTFRTRAGASGTGGNGSGYGPQEIQVRSDVSTNSINFSVKVYRLV